MKNVNAWKWIIGLTLVLIVGWLMNEPLMSRIVVAHGVTRTLTSATDIKSPVSARIVKQHVNNGDSVLAGSLLFELDSAIVQEQGEQAHKDLLNAEAQLWHIQSLIQGKRMNWPEPLQSLSANDRQIIDQRWQVEYESIRDKDSHFQAEIELQSQMGNTLKQRLLLLEQAHQQLQYQNEQQKSLWIQGFLSAQMWSKSQESLARSESDVLDVATRLKEVNERNNVLKQEKTAWWSHNHASWHQERQNLIRQTEQIRGDIRRIAHETRQLQIRSPIDGVVQDIDRATEGTWVNTSELLSKIVPVNTPIWVDGSLPQHERAHLQPGMSANIKLQAYDFTEFGVLKGTVHWIAAETRANGDAQSPEYALRIGINTTGATQIQPQPGMRAEIDIEVGRRSAASWLFAPMIKLWQESLREP